MKEQEPPIPRSSGLFGITEDFIERYQSLDERFVRNQTTTFFFRAKGTSMTPTILPDDILIVDRSISSYQNRVCIVSYEGELLCKRIRLEQNCVWLLSDHPRAPKLKVEEPLDSLIWGVVTAKITEFK